MSTTLPRERELIDGRAFAVLHANGTSIRLVAILANLSEAEVKRLIELAKKSGFKPQPDSRTGSDE